MLKVSLSGDWKKFSDYVKKVDEKLKDRKSLHEEAGKYMTLSAIPMRFRQQGPGWAPVERFNTTNVKPLQDTGRLRDSISFHATPKELEIGTPLIYAKIHNEGGTIRAQGKKFLAIPNPKVLTQSEVRNAKPRDFPNTFIRRNKENELWIYQTMPDDSIRAIYKLVKSVTIKQREFLYWDDRNLKSIIRRWERMIFEDSSNV